MKPQTLTSPSGDELVVLPRAEYEALIEAAQGNDDEDSADVAIYDARKAELAAGADARLPAEVSSAMHGGDRLFRALRKWRNVTQQQLAARTGLAQGYLSDVETGRKNASNETLTQIARALDIPAEWLIGKPLHI